MRGALRYGFAGSHIGGVTTSLTGLLAMTEASTVKVAVYSPLAKASAWMPAPTNVTVYVPAAHIPVVGTMSICWAFSLAAQAVGSVPWSANASVDTRLFCASFTRTVSLLIFVRSAGEFSVRK